MKFCTFYTEGFYEEIAKQYIIPSATKVGIDLFQVKLPSLKDWKKNSARKAEIIESCMTTLNDDIVMIDADATFEQYPSLFEKIPQEYDVAVHCLDVEKFWRNREGGTKRQLCSGTIMFRNSLKAKEILITWIDENKKYPNVLEQQNLQNVLTRSNYSVYQLPINYCAIINRQGLIPSYITDIVIKHHQISRIGKNNA